MGIDGMMFESPSSGEHAHKSLFMFVWKVIGSISLTQMER